MSTAHLRRFGKVAVLMGGWSAEREVSLKSGSAVLEALNAQEIDAHGIDMGADVIDQLLRGRFDRAFVIVRYWESPTPGVGYWAPLYAWTS